MAIRRKIKRALAIVTAGAQDALGGKAAAPAGHAAAVHQVALLPNPLEPTWIEEGKPEASSVTLSTSADALLSCGVWACTAGKFRFRHDADEIVHILAGAATVRHAGAVYRLGPGDVAHFPAGQTTYWDIPDQVRKFWVQRQPRTSLAGRLRRRLGL